MDPFADFLRAVASVPGIGPYLGYAPLLVALCALLDALFPQPAPGSAWVPFRRVIAMVGGNFGHASNLVPAGAGVPAAAPKLPAALLLAFMAASMLTLSACGAARTASVTNQVDAGIATAQADLGKAIQLYGIAKGIALVAQLADPSAAPAIAAMIATIDPWIAKAQAASAAASIDVPAAEALAATITSQAANLTITAAPVVRVLPAA